MADALQLLSYTKNNDKVMVETSSSTKQIFMKICSVVCSIDHCIDDRLQIDEYMIRKMTFLELLDLKSIISEKNRLHFFKSIANFIIAIHL